MKKVTHTEDELTLLSEMDTSNNNVFSTERDVKSPPIDLPDCSETQYTVKDGRSQVSIPTYQQKLFL